MNVLDLQRALGVRADGDYGPVTRAAVNTALTCADPSPLTGEAYQSAALRLRCERAAVEAVARVESGPAGAFDGAAKRPVILFEPHVFSRLTGGDFDRAYPTISYLAWGEKPYPKAQTARWAQLHAAMAMDPGAAISSASWGMFQIMGFNARACGFDTPWEFARVQALSSRAQLETLVAFLIRRGLDDELRDRRWAAFAHGYNGPAFAKHDYDGRLAAAFARAAA